MKRILTIILVIAGIGNLHGQQVVASGGQSGYGNQIQASATIGEAIIGSSTNGTYNSNQGFQQPLKKDITSTFEISPGKTIEFTIGPNPTIDRLNINLSQPLDCTVFISDVYGRWIKKTPLSLQKTSQSLDVSAMIPATYFIQLRNQKGKVLASLPFIKI